MHYCKLHDNKAYTTREADAIPEEQDCLNSGWYRDVGDGLVRVYCFKVVNDKLNKNKAPCLAEHKRG